MQLPILLSMWSTTCDIVWEVVVSDGGQLVVPGSGQPEVDASCAQMPQQQSASLDTEETVSLK